MYSDPERPACPQCINKYDFDTNIIEVFAIPTEQVKNFTLVWTPLQCMILDKQLLKDKGGSYVIFVKMAISRDLTK